MGLHFTARKKKQDSTEYDCMDRKFKNTDHTHAMNARKHTLKRTHTRTHLPPIAAGTWSDNGGEEKLNQACHLCTKMLNTTTN